MELPTGTAPEDQDGGHCVGRVRNFTPELDIKEEEIKEEEDDQEMGQEQEPQTFDGNPTRFL